EDEGSEDDDEEDSDAEEEDEEDEELKPYEELDEVDPDVAPVEKNVTNDKAALERVLASFKTDAGFFDTLTLTNPKPLNVPDADNDLERELEFYKQSLWAAMHAETLFNRADLPFHRPTDYFAEMVKTDAHMAKIRQGLLDEQAGMKASEEARKLRDAKKFGKKVQHERLRERERDKKAVGDKLESLKKRASPCLSLSLSLSRKSLDELNHTDPLGPPSQVARATPRSAATTLTSRSRTRSRRPVPPRRSARRTSRSVPVGHAPASRAPGATRSTALAAAAGGARRTT
ncbi:uncharacterized protein RHOBADRAFT_14979, partial [Rhodotorula graminis WP1]